MKNLILNILEIQPKRVKLESCKLSIREPNEVVEYSIRGSNAFSEVAQDTKSKLTTLQVRHVNHIE